MVKLLLLLVMFSPTAFAAKLVEWSSAESAKRFARSDSTDFFVLSNFFETQSNGIYCGPTSATIVLNSLRVNQPKMKIPKDMSVLSKKERTYLPATYDATFEKYTQRSVLRAKGIKDKQTVLGKPGKDKKRDVGFQVRQLDQLLRAHGLTTTLRVVDDQMPVDKIRDELVQNLKTSGDYVIINYKRKALGQKGGGHISPVAAYDKESDSFLVLDTNPNRAPWVWVETKDLVAAMKTKDTVENRGYILVKEGKGT